MILTNKYYDAIKWISLIGLPAIGVFYLALATTWNLPYPTEIVATIAAIDVLLASLIGVSTSNYKIKVAVLGFDIQSVFGDPQKGMFLSKLHYDILTWVAQIFLPAFITLYYALANVWHLPFAVEIVATLTAVDTFLGMLLGFSTSQFHKQVAIDSISYPAGLLNILDK